MRSSLEEIERKANEDEVEEDEIDWQLWWSRVYFVIKSHAFTFLMIIVGSVHLHYVVNRQDRIISFKIATLLGCTHNLVIYTGVVSYMFIWLGYFRKVWPLYVWWQQMFVTFLMAWLSVPIMWLPLISAQTYEWYIAFTAMIILKGFFTILAMFRKPFYNFTKDSLMKWTIRAFIFSSLGIIASIAWKSSQTDVVVAVIMVTSQTILIIICGRTIGCDEFYENEVEQNQYLFMILNHFNFISWFTHLVLALCKIRCVLAPYREKEKPSGESIPPSMWPQGAARNLSWIEDFSEVENFEYTY